MATKIRFPRIEACKTFFDIYQLLPHVRWKSAEYRALMLRWRAICRSEIESVDMSPGLLTANKKATAWKEIYEKCPSGSPEESIALGAWQSWMSPDSALDRYRTRVRSEALEALRITGTRVA